MTKPQAVAEVFWTAFKTMKPIEREMFIEKLVNDKSLSEDLRFAAMIKEREQEQTVSLESYLATRSTETK